MSQIGQLIAKVNRRQRNAAIVANGYKFSIVYFAIYFVAFICSRGFGIIPDTFIPATLFVPLGLAAATALLFTKPTDETESATTLDSSVNAKDLFLTAQLIENSAGDYQNLVLQQAQTKAQSVKVENVVPYHWNDKIRNIAGAMIILILGILFLPQWDPFGYEEVRQQAQAQEEDLKNSKKATAARKDLLKKQKGQSKAEVEKAAKELMTTFDQMQKSNKKDNLKKLNIQQEKIGRMWRQLNDEKLKQRMQQKTRQRFGMGMPDEAEQWKKDLLTGDTKKLQKKIDDLKKKVAAMKNEKDPAKKQQQKSDIKKEAQKVKDFLGNGMNAAQAANSMKRALEELAMSDKKNISSKSLEAMMQSMELTKQELAKLGEDVKAMKEMEEMLEAIQRAKSANNSQKGIDGEDTKGSENIKDYIEKYKEWTKSQEGQVGDGQEGQGEPTA